MLIQHIDLLLNNPLSFLLLILLVGFSVVCAISVHEFSHSFIAHKLGDSTSKNMGRMTLNPKAHLDPLGTILFFVAGFGWGKPVPVDVRALHNGRKSMATVALAGPFSNIATAFLLGIPFKLNFFPQATSTIQTLSQWEMSDLVATTLLLIIFINIMLAIFNLIPLFPLDGSKIVAGLLPRGLAYHFIRLEPLGPVLLLGIIVIDQIARLGLLSKIIGPIVSTLYALAVI
jgi:Zn-dependent protease